MSRTFVARAEKTYPAPRELVWAFVSDTNRSDRGMGLAPARYRWERDAEGRNVRVASAKEMGFALEWVEPPYRWLEGSFVEGRRDFVRGPAEAAGLRVELEDAPGGGTRLRAETFFTASGVAAWLLGPFQILKMGHNLRRYLAHLASTLVEAGALGRDDTQPAVVRAQRLLTRGYDPVTSGPRTPPNAPILDLRA
ncbi:MAG: hypothetical protein K8H88_13870, partial [Sandaracinaceae bacterium]|nr:hypothetical protein [Sandaracinaceae bacterium]